VSPPQLQRPAVQVSGAVHTLPQPPQFAGSVCMATQVVPQQVWSAAQGGVHSTVTQMPSAQI
jgi:hypothetical protein